VPLGALPDLPADGSSRPRHSKKQPSKGGSLGSISTKTGATGATGTSKIRQNIEQAADDFAVHVNHPQQVRAAMLLALRCGA
jgi:hypothetical protein